MLFAVVIGYGIQIAMSARSQFGRLLAMGITLNFFFYIMINAAMVMGLIPVVGIPMPLISYGGTAMLTVMFGFGLLMSEEEIERDAHREQAAELAARRHRDPDAVEDDDREQHQQRDRSRQSRIPRRDA